MPKPFPKEFSEDDPTAPPRGFAPAQSSTTTR